MKVARVFAFASTSMPHLRNSASSAWDFWSREMRRACEERARPGTPHRGAYERRHGPPTQDRRERCDLALRTGRTWPDPRQLRAGSSDPKAAVPASRAQTIFREAFNHAYAAHARDPRQEEAAFRIAWAAVKRVYEKVGDEWVEKG
jgi:cation transport regulator